MEKKSAIIRRKVAAKKASSAKKTAAKSVAKSAKKTIKVSVKTIPAKTTKKAAVKKAPVKKSKPKGKEKSETLMCFLTTACVNYYALPDDGYELNTLRKYRDTYLASSKGGQKLIAEYYKISPEIVKRVNQDKDKKSVYDYIHSQVLAACTAIENQNSLSAKKIYTNMVTTLIRKYHLN